MKFYNLLLLSIILICSKSSYSAELTDVEKKEREELILQVQVLIDDFSKAISGPSADAFMAAQAAKNLYVFIFVKQAIKLKYHKLLDISNIFLVNTDDFCNRFAETFKALLVADGIDKIVPCNLRTIRNEEKTKVVITPDRDCMAAMLVTDEDEKIEKIEDPKMNIDIKHLEAVYSALEQLCRQPIFRQPKRKGKKTLRKLDKSKAGSVPDDSHYVKNNGQDIKSDTLNTCELAALAPGALAEAQHDDLEKKHNSELYFNRKLFSAVRMGNFYALRQLVKQGADASKIIGGDIVGQWTPLMLAVKHCQEAAFDFLLDLNVDLTIRNCDGKTVLHYFVEPFEVWPDTLDDEDESFGKKLAELERTRERMLTKLLSRKVIDVDAQDSRGYTTLHYAIVNGYSWAVPLLLKAGADKNKRTPSGERAQDLALEFGHEDIYWDYLISTKA